ncbi:hypothetical protein FHS43_006215 [Streptosporangium becharense]|uniref:Uncharacterized protein n=1 Tax=Streptosporangium becharense TaxID=1816182 RepID=A0A7W9MH82_9ACTN|nr:hypothetical protein [Streptosporangium becharense]MBB2914903.1 hypothetical protein [Streptosporangium becharense]MBB5820286.1 hypothetical protein [Streptosporangium becharense]
MSDPLEHDARRLVGVFARRLRETAGTAPDILAADLVAIVRGHGWRPVEALKPPAPALGDGNGRAEYAARRAALDSRPPCVCGAAVTAHQLDGTRRTGCAATGCTRYAPAPAPERSA